MNRQETEYAHTLELRNIGGESLWLGLDAPKLWLAHATWYTPDFLVLRANEQMELREVNCFVRVKVVADDSSNMVEIYVLKSRSFCSWSLGKYLCDWKTGSFVR